jgi:hypothetical protein
VASLSDLEGQLSLQEQGMSFLTLAFIPSCSLNLLDGRGPNLLIIPTSCLQPAFCMHHARRVTVRLERPEPGIDGQSLQLLIGYKRSRKAILIRHPSTIGLAYRCSRTESPPSMLSQNSPASYRRRQVAPPLLKLGPEYVSPKFWNCHVKVGLGFVEAKKI